MCKIIMCTKVNDAVLACVASSLGDFLLMKEEGQEGGQDEVSPTFLTAVVPVNLRPLLAVMTGNIPNVNVSVAHVTYFLQTMHILHIYIYLINSWCAACFMSHVTFYFCIFSTYTLYIIIIVIIIN
jgi:hypothetical protein